MDELRRQNCKRRMGTKPFCPTKKLDLTKKTPLIEKGVFDINLKK